MGLQRYLFSKILDSREKDTVWHRGFFQNNEFMKHSLVTFYAGNELKRELNGKEVLIDVILQDTSRSIAQKKSILKPYFQKEVFAAADVLLHEICGRYFWFLMEFQVGYEETGVGDGSKEESCLMSTEVRMEFPKQTWLDYLPEVYRKGGDSFTERFLCIFRTLYEDLNEKIKDSPISFCPEVCDREFLQVIAGWLNIKGHYLWKEEQLRYLLAHAMEFYECRGTVKSVLWITALYTGEKPYLVEYHSLEMERVQSSRGELIQSLYGENPFRYTLLVKEEHIPGNTQYKTLMKILEDVTPAHMECSIVTLRPYFMLNSYSYVGINSIVGRYHTLPVMGRG